MVEKVPITMISRLSTEHRKPRCVDKKNIARKFHIFIGFFNLARSPARRDNIEFNKLTANRKINSQCHIMKATYETFEQRYGCCRCWLTKSNKTTVKANLSSCLFPIAALFSCVRLTISDSKINLIINSVFR